MKGLISLVTILLIICIICSLFCCNLLATLTTILAGVFTSFIAAFVFDKKVQEVKDHEFKENKILFICRVQSYIDNIMKNFFHPSEEADCWATIFKSPPVYIDEIMTIKSSVQEKRHNTLLDEQDDYVLSLINFFEHHKNDKTQFNDGVFIFLKKLKCIDELEDYLFKYMNIAPEYRRLDKIFYDLKESIRKFEFVSIYGLKSQKKANCFVKIEQFLPTGEKIPGLEDSYHLKTIFEKFKSLIDELRERDITIYICSKCKGRTPEASKKKNVKCDCGANLSVK